MTVKLVGVTMCEPRPLGPEPTMGLLDKVTEELGKVIDVPDLPDIDIRNVSKVVDLVSDNKDELVQILTRLPSLLGDAGEQMQAAGENAQRASGFLADDVQALTTNVADALDACHAQLGRIASVLGDLGRMLDRVPLIGDVADPVSQGLQAVAGVAGNLDEIAAQVHGIGGSLGQVGEGLGAMSGSLHGGGVALATLSVWAPAAAKTKAPAKQRAAMTASSARTAKTARTAKATKGKGAKRPPKAKAAKPTKRAASR
jgi:ABC-type transporter Mla subunit MlaD